MTAVRVAALTSVAGLWTAAGLVCLWIGREISEHAKWGTA